jgi:tetratricopeptide (TPR) repeat protein
MTNIFRKAGNYIAVFIFAGLAFSCVSTKSLLIEIPTPADKSLPTDIQSLTIVTQAVTNSYTDLSADSIQNLFYKQQFSYDTVIYDRQMADTTLKAIGELLFESGRYDYVIPQNRFLKPFNTSFNGLTLTWDTVKSLAQQFETDAVLSLDYLKTRVTTDFGSDTFFDAFSDGFYSAAQAEMQIIYEALFRVYNPVEEKIVMREFLRDTLLWEDADASTRNLFNRFTPVKQALTEAGIAIALDLSEKISVKWRTEQRVYFSKGSDEFQQAAQLVNNGNWAAAIAVWKELAESSKSKSKKSKAFFNIAVGYEMLGDVDEAISWALKSYETMFRQVTYDYLQTLERRKKELKNQEV